MSDRSPERPEVLAPKRKGRVLRWAAIVVGVLLLLAVTVPLAMLKFSEARVFAKMTPEQKAAFDEWYTKKIALPPEALEVKPYAPETIEAVREFLRQYEEDKGAVRAIYTDWATATGYLQAGKTPEALSEEGVAEYRGRLRPLAPLLAAYQTVVHQPDYSMSVWSTLQDVDPAGDNVDAVLYGHTDFLAIRDAGHLCLVEARVCLQEDRLPEALASADDLVATGQMDPYAILINKMMGVAILHMGLETYGAIAAKTADPESRRTIVANLTAHRERIHFDPPVPVHLLALDQIGLARQAVRLGVVADLEDKTGYEILREVGRVHADCLERLALPKAPNAADRKRIEGEIRAFRLPAFLYPGTRTGVRGYFTGWINQLSAATLYSPAMPGLEKARAYALGVLKQYDEMQSSLDPALGDGVVQSRRDDR